MSEEIRKSYIVDDDVEISNSGFSNVAYEEKRVRAELDKYSHKNQLVAMIWCIVFAGAHYFYVGRFGRGLLYMATGGFLLIGTFIDFFVIASGNFKDSEGRYLNEPKKAELEIKLHNIRKSAAENYN